jgi:hypothetical protein
VAIEYLPVADRGEYYRGLAAIMRARIPHVQSPAARLELASLAADYQNLATYVETLVVRTSDAAERCARPTLSAPEDGLRELARQRFLDGRMPPASDDDKVSARRGANAHMCIVCGGTIAPKDIEYEVQCSRGGRTLTFHVACHSAWIEESRAPA